MKRPHDRLCPKCEGAGVIPTGQSLIDAREERSVAQPQVAEALGTSVAYLSFIENGKKNLTPKRERQILAIIETLGPSRRLARLKTIRKAMRKARERREKR